MSVTTTPTRLATTTVVAIVVTELVALGSLTVPLVLGIAVRVGEMDVGISPESALALVAAPGALAAMLANLLFGTLSDRHGDRATWVLGGVVAGAFAVLGVATAPDLRILVVAWCLAQVAYNATFASLYGAMSDLVPEPDRARVSGWFGAAAIGAVVVSTGIASVLPKDALPLMLPMPLVAIPVTLWACRHLRSAPAGRRRPDRPRAGWWSNLRGVGQFWWVWLQRFLMQLAYGLAVSFGLFYLMRRTDLGEDAAATWVAATASVAAVLSAGASVVAGRLAGRRGAYGPYVVVSVLLLVAGLATKALGTSVAAYVVASVLLGIGIGCYFAVDLALVLRAVPRERAGQLLGLFNAARTLPQSIAPALSPLLLSLGDGDLVGDSDQNYAALFGAGLVLALLALLPLRRMTVLRRDGQPEHG